MKKILFTTVCALASFVLFAQENPENKTKKKPPMNLANRANFGTPANSPIQDATGRRNLTAGRITTTTTTGRQVQFALKVYF